MNKLFWNAVKVAPILFAALFAANGVNAQTISADKEGVNNTLEQINNYQKLDQSDLSQVTNVNQLRDVSPTDWAYEALRSLVDRYGCISGFPNQTYRGDQPLSRYEFAAGLNSCLNQIERLIASQDAIGQEDLDTINRLTQEFEAELATIGGRVDELESRTAVLEDSQFSTTTKLNGEAIFSINDAFGGGVDFEDSVGDFNDDGDENDTDLELFIVQEGGGQIDGDGNIVDAGAFDEDGDGQIEDEEIDDFQDDFEDDSELDDETTFTSRVRLNFDSSFTGKDRLRTRLEAGNIADYGGGDGITGTESARLGYDTNTEGFSVVLSDLHYRFPVGERFTVWVGPQGLDLDDIFGVTNPMLESSGTGALSRFNRRNPIAFRGTEGAGAGINLDIIPDRVGVNFGYLTDNAFDSDERAGLFNGSFSAGAQVEVSPFDALELSATYVRNYQVDGSDQSGNTVGGINDAGNLEGFALNPFPGLASNANKVGVGANFEVGEKLVLAGWGGYSNVKGIAEGDDNNPSGEVWSWGANVSLLDLIKEGSQLSLAGGMLPKFTSDIGDEERVATNPALNGNVQEDPDTSYIVEALYKFPLSDNILITPGVYAVFNPNHVDTNDTVYVGSLRTTFKF